MDALDKEIAARKAERDKHAQKVRDLEVMIAALERAASLRPTSSSLSVSSGEIQAGAQHTVSSALAASIAHNMNRGRKRGGRRQGDISKEWRQVLETMDLLADRHSYAEIAAITEMNKLELEMSSVRDRVRNLVRTGLLEGDANQGFAVTDYARQRFGISKENAPSEEDGAETEGAQSPQSRAEDLLS